jgi:hypothetical protein
VDSNLLHFDSTTINIVATNVKMNWWIQRENARLQLLPIAIMYLKHMCVAHMQDQVKRRLLHRNPHKEVVASNAMFCIGHIVVGTHCYHAQGAV